MGKIKFFNRKFFEDLKNKATINKLKNLLLKKNLTILFDNEFFDALPINQYEKKNDILYEKRVVIKNNKFQLIRKS